jgi:hypothetical protein
VRTSLVPSLASSCKICECTRRLARWQCYKLNFREGLLPPSPRFPVKLYSMGHSRVFKCIAHRLPPASFRRQPDGTIQCVATFASIRPTARHSGSKYLVDTVPTPATRRVIRVKPQQENSLQKSMLGLETNFCHLTNLVYSLEFRPGPLH